MIESVDVTAAQGVVSSRHMRPRTIPVGDSRASSILWKLKSLKGTEKIGHMMVDRGVYESSGANKSGGNEQTPQKQIGAAIASALE